MLCSVLCDGCPCHSALLVFIFKCFSVFFYRRLRHTIIFNAETSITFFNCVYCDRQIVFNSIYILHGLREIVCAFLVFCVLGECVQGEHIHAGTLVVAVPVHHLSFYLLLLLLFVFIRYVCADMFTTYTAFRWCNCLNVHVIIQI